MYIYIHMSCLCFGDFAPLEQDPDQVEPVNAQDVNRSQALFALVVIHGCCFFDWAWLNAKLCNFPNMYFSTCSNPSTNSTFAVTP